MIRNRDARRGRALYVVSQHRQAALCQSQPFALQARKLRRKVKAAIRTVLLWLASIMHDALCSARKRRNSRIRLTRGLGTSATSRAMTCMAVLMSREAGCRERRNLTGPPQLLQVSMSMWPTWIMVWTHSASVKWLVEIPFWPITRPIKRWSGSIPLSVANAPIIGAGCAQRSTDPVGKS